MGENKLAYERIGNTESNTTLIFLHGSTMTKEGMLPFAKKFEDYNCVIYDLTAHGKSGGEEPADVSSFASDVEESIQDLQQEKIVSERMILLGYSMGGAITCEIAIRKNIKLAGIVLLSSGGDLKNHTPMVDELKEMPVENFKTEEILDALFGVDTPQTDRERIKELFATTKEQDVTGYGDLMVSNSYDNLASCKEIDIPALMVHGDDDKIVLPTAAIETWKMIKNSRLFMIPYKGHGAIYEDTCLVRDKILSFIKMCV